MSKIEHGLGISPVLKRLAFNFLCKGVGRYPFSHPLYDEVVVQELYPWNAPEGLLIAQGGLVVTFKRQGKRVRWVEYSITQSGGGGEPILKEV